MRADLIRDVRVIYWAEIGIDCQKEANQEDKKKIQLRGISSVWKEEMQKKKRTRWWNKEAKMAMKSKKEAYKKCL